MKRREFLRMAVAGALAGISRVSFGSGKTARPNFVFIIADDCTFRDIGCYGGQAHTPNIDKLASEGMRFTQCFQSAPMCSPTRHNIYTGLYPVKSGAYPNHAFAKDGTKSVVHYLKPLGYRLALSGKKHINPLEVFPFEYSGKGNNPDFEAIDKFINNCKENGTPFCLFACSNEPHSPWNKGDASRYDAAKLKLPPYFVDTVETRENMTRYLAEITYYDWQVGQTLALLEKYALTDNTLVIVVSEQGSSFPFGKWTCYDTGLQSAFIARWPGKIEPGTVSDALIEYVDVLPTYIEAAGGTPENVLDGKSLLPVLKGQTTEHKQYVFGEMTTRGIINGSDYFGIRSIRSAKFKYLWNFTPEVKFQNACTNSSIFESWRQKAENDADAADKVRRYEHRPAEELYDVEKDPYEWNNLADDPQYATIKMRMKKRLLAWMKEMGDKGRQTELEALEHQNRSRNKKSQSSSKKLTKKQKKAAQK
jgi:N-sulfoglucosamine sulfohydrolase